MRQYAATQKHHDLGVYFDKMKPTLVTQILTFWYIIFSFHIYKQMTDGDLRCI